MIIYNPLDGDVLGYSITSQPRRCFLITQLGKNIPPVVEEIHESIKKSCKLIDYQVIDAGIKTTGRDFLLKIWKLIASVPMCIVVLHEDTPLTTQTNLFYELGVAQALGKETIIIKTPNAKIASDFVRSEYIEYDKYFQNKFNDFLNITIKDQAEHYETLSENLENNPLLAIDYIKRAYLITGDEKYQKQAKVIIKEGGFGKRAKNSIEFLTAKF